MFTSTTVTNTIIPFKDAFARHYPLPAPVRTWGGLGCAAVLSAVDLVSGASGAQAVERILRAKLQASIIAAQEAHLDEIWELGGGSFDVSIDAPRGAEYRWPADWWFQPGLDLHAFILDNIVPDDDDEQPGDVEAALARLEGRIDPRVQATKDSWASERFAESEELRREIVKFEKRKRSVKFAHTAQIKYRSEDDQVTWAERARTVKIEEDGHIDWKREGFMGRVFDGAARELAHDGELSERTAAYFEELGVELDGEGNWFQVGESDLGDGLEEEEDVEDEDEVEVESVEEAVDPAPSCVVAEVDVVDFAAYAARAHGTFDAGDETNSDGASLSEGDDSGYASEGSDCGEIVVGGGVGAKSAQKAKAVGGGWFSSWFAYEQSTGSSELHTRIADIACAIY